MAYVTFLGNCANLTKDLHPVSFLVEDTERILVDAGPTVIQQLYKLDYLASKVDAVVVTHSHGDHTLGFPYFAFSKFFEGLSGATGPSKVPLIALQGVIDGLRNMLEFCYPPGKYPTFEFVPYVASATDVSVFEVGKTKITTFPVTHAVPNIGLRIELSNKAVISYSSDTVLDEKVIHNAADSDILIHEAFGPSELRELAARTKHGLADEAGKVAEQARVDLLALVHLMPKYLTPEGKSSVINDAKAYYKGDVIVPDALTKLFISRKGEKGEPRSV